MSPTPDEKPDDDNPPSERESSIEPLDVRIPHSPVEDILGVLIGTFMAAMGLYILEQVEAVTGGTAGLALLISYATPLNFATLFILVNLPFFLLAVWRKGWKFTIKTLVSVAMVSGFTLILEQVFPADEINPVFGVIAGNVLLGVALLIVFRHGSSLGGFNILALIAQEQFNMRAGYVQMSLDVTVILLALTVVSPLNVLLSALGAVILNIILAFNHRPGRYRA